MILLAVILGALGVYLSAYTAYQLLLFAANALIPGPPPLQPGTIRRLAVVVPAHDEEVYITRLLRTLAEVDYPRDAYRVVVVADNCTDRTVELCRTLDVDVLERVDADRQGKGYAIEFALDFVRRGRYDALVVVDADSLVDHAFLRELNLQIERGDRVIQCYNAVANPGQTWLTRLMNVSRTISNEIIHPAKRKLGLSSHLMGNGMCFDLELLESCGWNSFSVGEDWQFYARLVSIGEQIGFAHGARVYHQESLSLAQASSQRLRWSSGRFEVLLSDGVPLCIEGLRRMDLRRIDASLPLVFPNPSLGMNLTLLGFFLALAFAAAGESRAFLVWFAALSCAQALMFCVGVLYTQEKLATVGSLVLAPAFLVWKFGIDFASFLGFGRKRWRRTERRLH